MGTKSFVFDSRVRRVIEYIVSTLNLPAPRHLEYSEDVIFGPKVDFGCWGRGQRIENVSNFKIHGEWNKIEYQIHVTLKYAYLADPDWDNQPLEEYGWTVTHSLYSVRKKVSRQAFYPWQAGELPILQGKEPILV